MCLAMTATLNEDCNDDDNDHDNNGDVDCAEMACFTYRNRILLIKFIFVVMVFPLSFLCWGLKNDPWVEDMLIKKGWEDPNR